MADAFSSAFSYLKSAFLTKGMGGAGGIGVCPRCGLKAGKFGGKPCDECEAKPLGEGAEVSQVNQPPQKPMMNKALNPSSIHEGDAELPEDQRRHYANYQRALQMFGRPNARKPFNPNHPDPNEPIFTDEFVAMNPWMGDANREHMGLPPLNPPPQPPMSAAPFPRTAGGPRTLPPNPPLMPPRTELPSMRESPGDPATNPRPLSEDNPYGRIRESELQRLADDFGIPFTKAWTMLKALPEQQMFVERSPRENVVDDYQLDYQDRPEIDRFGARSLGTVHPAILGMLQRRTNDYHQTEGIAPNLNLDLGREADTRIESDRKRYSNYPEDAYGESGMSIAQGPDFNRRMYDSGGQMGARSYQSDETHHNPDRAARGGPFDQSRYASGHRNAHQMLTGYGYQPSHRLTHPKMGEYD